MGPVDVARAAAAALGEQDHGQAAAARRSRTAGPSSGGCASPGFRPGPCSRRTWRRVGWPSTSPTPATRPSAGVRRISSSLSRRPSWAAKISGPYSTNVPGRRGRPGSPGPCGGSAPALCHGLGPGFVEAESVAVEDGLEVRARLVGGRLVGVGGGAGRGAVHVDHGQKLALLDGLADLDLDPPDDAGAVGQDLVLHLHRLEDDQRLAGADWLLGLVGDGDHRAGERGGDELHGWDDPARDGRGDSRKG